MAVIFVVNRRSPSVYGFRGYIPMDPLMSELFWPQLVLMVACGAAVLIVGVAVLIARLRE